VFCLAISFFVILVGLVYADITTNSRFMYHNDQYVAGNGFFSDYGDTSVANLELRDHAHGSGSYDYRSIIEAYGAQYRDLTGESVILNNRRIVIEEGADFSYSPVIMQLGTYSRPISFRSLGEDKICLKNYASNTSVNAVFNYAGTLSKNLSADLFWRFSQNDDVDAVTVDNQSRTIMDIEAAFAGDGHIGVLDQSRGRKKVDVLIDEDYRGTYSISKKISHEVKYMKKQQIDDWIPCCSDGFDDMNYQDQTQFKSAKGIFDCTCSMLPGTIRPNA
jgi:hypothetical protein